MKTLRRLVETALANVCLAVAAAYGATAYNFAYQFTAGEQTTEAEKKPMTVSGTLTGDPAGDLVENVTVVSVFFNGVEAPGPFVVAEGSVVSLAAEQNSFLFIDPLSALAPWFADQFGLGWSPGSAHAMCYLVPLAPAPLIYSGPIDPERWSLAPAALEFIGFLPPLGGADATGGSFAEPVRTFNRNGTIPVKFTAACDGVPVTSGVHTLVAVKWTDETVCEPAIPVASRDTATTDNEFRLASGQWHFNVDARATGMSPGKWQLIATLSDDSQHSVWIRIK